MKKYTAIPIKIRNVVWKRDDLCDVEWQSSDTFEFDIIVSEENMEELLKANTITIEDKTYELHLSKTTN